MQAPSRKFRVATLLVLALALMIAPVQRALYAQGYLSPLDSFGTPTEFVVTVNECSLSTNGGGTYPVQLFNTPVSFDVAEGDAGADIETLVDNAVVPAGTYNSMRCTADQTVQFTAEISFNPGDPLGVRTPTTYYTGGPTVGGIPSAKTTGPATSIQLTDPSGDFEFTQAISLTVAAGDPQVVKVSFTLEGAVELYNQVVDDALTSPADPSVAYFILLPDEGNGLTVNISVVP